MQSDDDDHDVREAIRLDLFHQHEEENSTHEYQMDSLMQCLNFYVFTF